MAAEDVKRKLTAIFSADVVGYSRLMGDDELATVQTLTSHQDTMRKLVKHYRGRVVDAVGDNLMAEFVSVVDAVQCAVEVQQVLSTKNEALPDNRKMLFRIGINLGDVIEEGERIYGDGVNIAARVESLADAGGICVSGSAFEQIENKLALGYQYMGEHSVKNIVKPIKVYKVPMGPGKIKEKKPVIRGRRKTIVSAVAVLILAAIGFGIWNFYFRYSPDPVEPASIEKMAYPLPDKPSIAVLPFDNMSGDPKQEFLVDGITENIIASLASVPEMFVIARNSTFTYKNKPVEIRQVSEALGVRYVLEGSVQRSGDQIRITAQLIDATKGHYLWAKRYDRNLKDLFALQDEITIKILEAMQVILTEGERIRGLAGGTENLDAYLKVLEGSHHYWRFTRDDHKLARQIFEEVITMNPEYIAPYNLLAEILLFEAYQAGWGKSPKKSREQAFKFLQKALALDESHPVAHANLSWYYVGMRQTEKAIAEAEKAIAIDPNYAIGYLRLGFALRYAGRPQEVIPVNKKGLRLSPLQPFWFLLHLGYSYRDLGRYEEAIPYFKKAVQADPTRPGPHRGLAVSYAVLGRDEEARAQVEELQKKRLRAYGTKYTLKHWKKEGLRSNRNPDVVAKEVELLRKAGMPE